MVSFFTQFFYIGWLGAAVITILAVAIQQVVWLFAGAIRLKKAYVYPLTFIPSVLLFCYTFIPQEYKNDPQFREAVEYDYLVRAQKWNRILAKSYNHPPVTMNGIWCTNFALGMKGMLLDNMFFYKQDGPDGLLMDALRIQPLALYSISDISFEIGMINSAERFAFDIKQRLPDNHKSGRIYKRLAEANLVNGHYKVARRYMHVLQSTLFYRNWANHYIAILGDEQAINRDARYGALRTKRQKQNDQLIYAFSMTMTDPAWTLVREVSMESYEQLILRVQRVIAVIGAVVLLIALAIYRFWLKKFMRQFNLLLNGIVRMGEGKLEPIEAAPFTIGEFEIMQQDIDRTSHALIRQMDTIRRMERERMEQENKIKEQEQIVKELSTARQIQRSVLPHIFPPFPERKEINLYASMDPARDVGGDFYDFFFTDEDHLCLVIADVSGKGIPAALFMMFAKRIIEDYAKMEIGAGEILKQTNEFLCDNNQADMFVTVWLGILNISTGKLTCANAGHEYPAIRRNGGSFVLFQDKHGFVIGGMAGVPYKEYTLFMEPGDKIFVYTDGVPEARAADGEMFGVKRMVAALNTNADGRPDEILRNVRSAVDEFVGDAEQFDDITMLCVEYLGSKSASL